VVFANMLESARRRSAFSNIVIFEFADALRSRWLIVYALLIFSFSFFLLSLSSGGGDVAASLLNFVLLLVPLFLLVYGTVAFHGSLSFQRVILALGVSRTTLYAGQFVGRLLGLLPGFAVGLLVAFILASSIEAIGSLFLILTYGLLLNAVFLALSFLLSQLSERLELLIAAAMGIWFVLYVLYDSLLMLMVIFFGDFPLQNVLLSMTLVNPIDTMRSIVLMQGNLQSLMTHSSAVYAKVLSGYTGVIVGTIVLFLQAGVAAFIGLHLYRKRDL